MTPFPSVNLLDLSAEAIHARITQPTLQHFTGLYLTRARALLDPDSPQFLDHRKLEKPFWRSREGIFVVPQAMQILALAGAITQESAFSEAARDVLLAIIDHGLADSASLAWGVTTSGWRHGEGHDKFLLALGVWCVLEFAGSSFAPQDRSKVKKFLEDSLQISLALTQQDNANVTNNRGIRGLAASALWALMLDSFAPAADRDTILKRAWISLEKHLYFVFDAQGAPYEGPAYAGNTLGSLTLVAEILRRAGQPDILQHRSLERHPRYLAYELTPGQATINNLNDSHAQCGSISGCLHRMSLPGGEIIAWLARQLDLAPQRTDGELVNTPVIRDYLNFLLWWDESIPTRSPDDLKWPTSAVFPIRGVASHRTGWHSSDILVSHFCGRQEVLCHRQGDQNHVALYAGGERVLVDAGYGDEHKDMSQKMNRWFGLTEAHNCVLIDGLNQRGVLEAPGWGEGEMLEFGNTETRSYSLGDASSATGKDHRVRQSRRKVTLHRLELAPVVTILDVNERDGGSFVTEILWHTHPDNRWSIHATGGIIHTKTLDWHVFVFNLRNEAFQTFGEDGFGRPRLRVRSESALSEFATILIPLPKDQPSPIVRRTGRNLELQLPSGRITLEL
ncbi:heparinase II/III-like protein [Terrimicrobium sacchariphilum]|uniref:Heparinase II/III-like protein n=1 Tax=Terrimicrobium sacchariphilum TaxID=690879 RepID=A0A146GF05_TERSA|nr:heparinase II/III family protein [Terrimicrobium sacchariphilum]GAT35217.1 heparinase II/III-like protein [Terrimicrobium sacchariphilum]